MKRTRDWEAVYQARQTSADTAAKVVRSGQRILVGSGCAAPSVLLDALLRRRAELEDVELVHLLTYGIPPYTDPEYEGVFRHNAFFIGGNVREAVRGGRADYTPIFLSEIPRLFTSGQMPIDVALIMVSPPNRFGYCSLGIHPDILMAGIDTAGIVVAQVNEHMPEVAGDTYLHVSEIEHFVRHDAAIVEIPPPELDDVSERIAKHVAELIADGATLQLGIGRVPHAVAMLLGDHNDLGLHTEMFSDSVVPLVESGVITNRRKGFMEGKAIASFAMGTKTLYDFLDGNPFFEFHRTEFVNDPRNICRNRRMTSINAAIEVDLTGQISADSIGSRFYSGIGGQVDFIRGAAMSDGGKPIIVVPSTARDGAISRIVPTLSEGAGVVTSRGDVHYVVTEYGVADLHGRSIRQRAERLIEIAHPDFRPELRAAAVRKRFIPVARRPSFDAPKPPPTSETRSKGRQKARAAAGSDADEPTPEHTASTHVAYRPLRPEDVEALQAFFRTHSARTVRDRYRYSKRDLTREEAEKLCSLDYRNRFAVGAFITSTHGSKIVGVGRYEGDPGTHVIEVDLVVGERWRRRGVATALWKRLVQRGREVGFGSCVTTFAIGNHAARGLARSLGLHFTIDDGEFVCEARLIDIGPTGRAARIRTAVDRSPDSSYSMD